jgi:hypothetical protein
VSPIVPTSDREGMRAILVMPYFSRSKRNALFFIPKNQKRKEEKLWK